LGKNVENVADENGGKKKNRKNPSEKRKFRDRRNVAHGMKHGQKK
jgi:hypothetical protein